MSKSIQVSTLNRTMELDNGAARLAVAASNYGAVLPVDVLYDILLRLPAKELCRLRLVCRSWRLLTSDPLFARAHLSRHPPHAVVLRYDRNEVHVIDLRGSVIKRIRIGRGPGEVLSTHGDLACVSHGWGLAYVFNLSTGAMVADIDIESRSKVNAEKPVCVLGHVPATGEYKLLRIQDRSRMSYNNNGGFVTSCEVMTLGGGGGRNRQRWRKRPPPPALLSSWSVAVVAGVAYFLLPPPRKVGEAEPDGIAVFDMAAEEWKPTTIQGPSSSIILETSSAVCRRKQFGLATLNERLVTVYCNLHQWSTQLWLLVDMEESLWTKLYTLQGTQFWDVVNFCFHYPLTVFDDGRILVSGNRTGAIRAYDPRTGAWADLATVSGHVVMHHGSLLCPNLWGC
ncbi:unnamed protein product [Urochloa decumbens]|uniref:F-box domain-containing protein n=1 Tax=Urochloa decumbens TaxID=240449 RepID=A0ABC8VWG9_9POAL